MCELLFTLVVFLCYFNFLIINNISFFFNGYSCSPLLQQLILPLQNPIICKRIDPRFSFFTINLKECGIIFLLYFRMKTMLSDVVVGIFIIAVSINVVLLCPNNCSCFTTAGLIIDCNNKGLTAIPRDFPNDSSSM